MNQSYYCQMNVSGSQDINYPPLQPMNMSQPQISPQIQSLESRPFSPPLSYTQMPYPQPRMPPLQPQMSSPSPQENKVEQLLSMADSNNIVMSEMQLMVTKDGIKLSADDLFRVYVMIGAVTAINPEIDI